MIQFFNITKTTKWLVSAPDERVAAMIKAARRAPLPDWVLRTSSMKPGALAQDARARDDMVFMVEAVPGRQTEASLPPPDGQRRPAEPARIPVPGRGGVRPRKPRHPPADGLKSAAQAAARLGCSIKTLNAHVASGALKYVDIGHGKRRQRRMFSDADLNEFIANKTRKVTPCPSTAGRARPTGISTFTGEVIDFTGPRKPPRDAKPRK